MIILDNLTVITFSGEGAEELLQGQLTCDVLKVSEEQSSLGALCNVKGRVVSSFILTFENPNQFNLICLKETSSKTIGALEKYFPFYKVEVKQDNNYQLFALAKPEVKIQDLETSNEQNTFYYKGLKLIDYLEKEFFLVVSKKNDNSPLITSTPLSNDINKWNVDDIYADNIEITQELSELYTPHELNYQKTQRVDFEKGCYTGQEIVARMHYRAKNLPKIRLGQITKGAVQENMTIQTKLRKKVGNILKVAKKEEGLICIASMKIQDKAEDLEIEELNIPFNIIR
tara:strand:+ start:525 stop:1382 length:858 start_codon:yes stop_codon:yes gene_type:complete